MFLHPEHANAIQLHLPAEFDPKHFVSEKYQLFQNEDFLFFFGTFHHIENRKGLSLYVIMIGVNVDVDVEQNI
jgi:hypothetical protein